MNPRIIVSVVESSAAEHDAALTWALSLARWYGSDLHVVDVQAGRRLEHNGDDAVRGALDTRIAGARRGAGLDGVNAVAVTPVVLSGPPVRAVGDYVSRVAADLVVVGRETRRGDGFWTTGSFAATLAADVSAPTMAVPTGLPPPATGAAPFRNILSAIDFSKVSFRAMSHALRLAQESGGRLRLLHVLDGFPYESAYSGSQAMRLIDEFRTHAVEVARELHSLVPADAFNWSDIDVAAVSGVAHGAIVKAAAEQPTDLVVLGLPRRGRLEQFVAGSTAQKVIRRATSPVLMVPGPATAAHLAHRHREVPVRADAAMGGRPLPPRAVVPTPIDASAGAAG